MLRIAVVLVTASAVGETACKITGPRPIPARSDRPAAARPPAMTGTASGHFRLGASELSVKHGYAFRVEDNSRPVKLGTLVVLSDTPLEVSALADKLDLGHEARTQIEAKGGGGVLISIGPNHQEQNLFFFMAKPEEGLNVLDGEFRLTSKTEDRSEGSWVVHKPSTFVGKTCDFALRWAADVSTLGVRGAPLPQDGAAPGKAFLAYVAAAVRGDRSALPRLVTPELWPDDDAGDISQALRWEKATEVAIAGGLLREDHAILRVEAVDDGDRVRGRVLMRRLKESWRYADTRLSPVH